MGKKKTQRSFLARGHTKFTKFLVQWLTNIWRNKKTDHQIKQAEMYFCHVDCFCPSYTIWLCSSLASVVVSARSFHHRSHYYLPCSCFHLWLLYYEAVELYLKCTSYTYITFNRGVSLEHSTAIRSNSKQVIAEFPIMLNLKSLFALIADPALQGVVQKHVFGKAFKPRQQNMCWGKWFKTLRKQSFILEGLFTWDNKLLPRKGAIHQETPQPRTHWLEWASAIMGPWWIFIIHMHPTWMSRLSTCP